MPADVHDRIMSYGRWLATADVPKLFIEAVPGVMFTEHRALARSWPHQEHLTVSGSLLVPEDAPDEIGGAVANWVRVLP